MREARHSRPFHGLFPGLVLVLLGGLFLAGQQNWITADAWWQWLLIGLGAIFIISGLVQYHAPEISSFPKAPLCLGAVLIALGTVSSLVSAIGGRLFLSAQGRHHIGRFMVKGEPGKICQGQI